MHLIYRRDDPHVVYYRIFPYCALPPNTYYIRRGFMELASEFKLVGFLFVLLGDLCATIRCCRYSGRDMVLFEFSVVTALLFLFPLSFIFDFRALILNVNHNLNKSSDVWFLRHVVSSRLRIGFIEPSISLLSQFPFIEPIRLRSAAFSLRTVKTIYCFLGTREEQWLPAAADYVDILKSDVGEYLNLVLVGGKSGLRLSNESFQDISSGQAAIVLLYDTNRYSTRHSGIALEAIVSRTPLFMLQSELAQHYAWRGFDVSLFSSPLELKSSIRQLLNSSEHNLSSVQR